MDIERNVVITSSEQKQSWKYLFTRHLSEEGLPDDFSHIRQFLMSCIGNKEFRELLEKELNELENSETGKIMSITKRKVLSSINMFQKLYYINSIVVRQIKELDKRFEEDNKMLLPLKEEKQVYHRVRRELREILKELNLELPLINDYLYIALTIIIKNSDLQYEGAPKEQIVNPNKFSYNEQSRSRI